jgi:hypothetical protein
VLALQTPLIAHPKFEVNFIHPELRVALRTLWWRRGIAARHTSAETHVRPEPRHGVRLEEAAHAEVEVAPWAARHRLKD